MRLREIPAGEITDTIRRLRIEADTILIDIVLDIGYLEYPISRIRPFASCLPGVGFPYFQVLSPYAALVNHSGTAFITALTISRSCSLKASLAIRASIVLSSTTIFPAV